MKKSQLKEIIREVIREELQHESQASDDAKRQGLEYKGFGRWGKDGKITHTTQSGKLVPVRDPKTGQADRKLLSPPRVHKSPETQRKANQPKDDLTIRSRDHNPNSINTINNAKDVILGKIEKAGFGPGDEVPKNEFMKKTGLTQKHMDTWANVEHKYSNDEWYVPVFSDHGDTVVIRDPWEL